MFDDNLPSDIETTKGASFDDVTGIVGFARIDSLDNPTAPKGHEDQHVASYGVI